MYVFLGFIVGENFNLKFKNTINEQKVTKENIIKAYKTGFETGSLYTTVHVIKYLDSINELSKPINLIPTIEVLNSIKHERIKELSDFLNNLSNEN